METPQQSEYKVYPKRFFIAFQFMLVQMMTAILVNTFTPIAAYLAVIYDKDPVVINLAGLLFVLMHPIFTFPAAYFIDTYGSRMGIMIGSILCIIGISMRMLINQGFYFAIIGQVIAGIGRPFIINCQTKVSASWFSAQSRGTVTQILTLVMNVSLVFGIFVPVMVFGDYNPDIVVNPDTIQEGRELAFRTMLVQACMGYVCYLINIIFQQSTPPTPPSASENIMKEPFSFAIPKLFKNINYLCTLLSFGCFFGIFNGISVVLSFMLKPWYGDEDLPLAVAVVGGSPIISGIIGVIIFAPLQKKSKVYKYWIILCMIGSSTAMIIFYPLLQTGALFWASFASAYNSFFLIPLVPIMLEFGCELAFPVGQGSATGLMFAMGNLFGFFLGLILSVIIKGQTKMQTAYGIIFCFAVFLVGLFLSYFSKEELNRSNFESDESSRKSLISSKTETSKAETESYKDKEDLQTGLLDKQQQNLLL